jgi:hypothetical protein
LLALRLAFRGSSVVFLAMLAGEVAVHSTGDLASLAFSAVLLVVNVVSQDFALS